MEHPSSESSGMVPRKQREKGCFDYKNYQVGKEFVQVFHNSLWKLKLTFWSGQYNMYSEEKQSELWKIGLCGYVIFIQDRSCQWLWCEWIKVMNCWSGLVPLVEGIAPDGHRKSAQGCQQTCLRAFGGIRTILRRTALTGQVLSENQNFIIILKFLI